MPSTHKREDARVSTRVSKEVQTPLGSVFVTYMRNEVVVSFHNKMPECVRFDTRVEDGLPELHVRLGKRPPRMGDELTQNGRTFEVNGVRMTDGNKVQVMDDMGVWEDWRED